jgi:hypothetical protein
MTIRGRHNERGIPITQAGINDGSVTEQKKHKVQVAMPGKRTSQHSARTQTLANVQLGLPGSVHKAIVSVESQCLRQTSFFYQQLADVHPVILRRYEKQRE